MFVFLGVLGRPWNFSKRKFCFRIFSKCWRYDYAIDNGKVIADYTDQIRAHMNSKEEQGIKALLLKLAFIIIEVNLVIHMKLYDYVLFFRFSRGHPCPMNFNPADHFILTLAVVPGKEKECRERIKVINLNIFWLQSNKKNYTNTIISTKPHPNKSTFGSN